jgi:hypothetical protein
MLYNHDQDQGPELAEAFTALGNAEGATPFTRLILGSIAFDVTGLFSSRRCSALRELELFRCDGITEQSMQALATNVRDSLVSLMVSMMSIAPIVPLLAGCRRLERLILHSCNTADMQVIGETCKAPLRSAELFSDVTIDDYVCAIVPALSGIVFLHIDCSVEAVLQHIIPRCPYLQVLRVRSSDIVKQLRSVIPKHITVIS